jgi:hypothetical protein
MQFIGARGLAHILYVADDPASKTSAIKTSGKVKAISHVPVINFIDSIMSRSCAADHRVNHALYAAGTT